MGLIELKARMRAGARARRRELAPSAMAAAALSLAEHSLQPAGLRTGQSIAGFHPMADEIDPRPLMARLAVDGYYSCLPVVEGKGKPLFFRVWRPGDRLEPGVWGIEQPAASAGQVSPDVVLVPLLAVDPSGHRLGYGGGYYDRTLRGLRSLKPIVAIGIAFDHQLIEAVPHHEHDERLDWLLLPSGLRKCAVG